MIRSALLSEGLAVLPRVLGLCDRDPSSPTYGCCDRYYWHYRMTDYANMRFQEAGLLFALAYRAAPSESRWHAHPALSDWSRAVWRFWISNSNRDGSVSEAYPYDHGFCATAFSSAAFVESVLALGGKDRWVSELAQARRTFLWLGRNDNPEVGNQMAASLHALVGYARLTGDEEILALAKRRRADVLALAPAGFTEYGGTDAGYLTVTLGSLSRVLSLGGPDEELRAAILPWESWLCRQVSSDGTLDPEANSRRTQFVYPSGLVYLESEVVERVGRGLANDTCIRPSWMDDRYCIPFATDYLFAAWEAGNASVSIVDRGA